MFKLMEALRTQEKENKNSEAQSSTSDTDRNKLHTSFKTMVQLDTLMS